MFLSRLRLNPADPRTRRDLADCQHLHRTVMSAFSQVSGPARSALGVLFRLEATEQGVVLLVQSHSQPDWSCLPQGYCVPAGVVSKPVGDKYAEITNGTTLRFRLRANPTKRLPTRAPGEKRDGPRVDIRPEKQQMAWLERKAEAAGFHLMEVRFVPEVADVSAEAELIRVRGRHHAGKLTFASVLFEGRLRVEDAGLFRRALEHGVGTAKAYGFGLLSVAPSR